MFEFITIDGQKIGAGQKPYIIAEISANHNGDLELAKRTIKAAKLAGADAIKLQTYTPDTITLDSDKDEFKIKGGLWDGRTLYDLYKQAHLPWEWHKPLFDYAKSLGITIFSSPFDTTAVDFLERLNTPAYKIASFEAVDTPLIEYVARTGKPIIISTGMASKEEISDAIDAAKGAGCKQIAILHCVSGYPAPAEEYNLNTISDMQKRYKLVTGLSDHTIDNTTAIVAVGLGASIIEKHFTLDRNNGGPDDSFSTEPKELADLCRSSEIAWKSLGSINYDTKQSEGSNIQLRRSLYYVKDIKAGESITIHNVKSVRPGFGLPPKMLPKILGGKVTKDIQANTAVSIDDIEF